jgi:hypothetical protein
MGKLTPACHTNYLEISSMAQLGDAIARYHKLLEQPSYRETGWAEQFQEQMRQQHLVESGRLLAPVLRPHFISRRQLDALSRLSKQMAEIMDRLEAIAFASPLLLNRLQMLPAEKMLAALPHGYARSGVTASMDANLTNGSLSLQGMDACKPAGLAYSNMLAELFLELPILKEFKRGRYKLTKLGGPKSLLQAIQSAYRQFGGKRKPAIAIVELGQESGSGPAATETASSEGRLLAESLSQLGGHVRLIPPELLEYTGGKLHSEDFAIDLVFRRVSTREILTRWDLSHPLLRAYRDGTVCVVNSFRAEFAQRRALFDLLTDETVTAHLPTADRKLIRNSIAWTRVVVPRKTMHGDKQVDLPEFILNQREHLALLPNEDSSDQRIYIGAEMTAAAWDRALKLALRTPYVVQERSSPVHESFPLFQYGELKMKEAEVTVHPHVLNGEMSGASAVLQTCLAGSAAHLAVAPVFLLEET